MILTTSFLYPSAVMLRDAINEEFDCNLMASTRISRTDRRIVHIRFGNSEECSNDLSINSKGFIRLCANKYNMSLFLKEKGILSPEFFTSLTTPTEYPVLSRDTLTGTHGRGITIINNQDEFFNSDIRWWTPALDIQSEFRILVVGGKVTKIFKKVLTDESPIPENGIVIMNNNNCKFSLRSDWTNFRGIIEYVEDRLHPLFESEYDAGLYGLDFAKLKNGNYCVIENNSAPGMSGSTAGAAAKKLKEVYHEEFLRSGKNSKGG